MKNIISISIFLVCLINCSCQNRNNSINKNYQEHYIIPDSLYSFFPKESFGKNNFNLIFHSTNAKKNNLPYFKEEFAVTELVTIYKCNDKLKFDSLKNIYMGEHICQFLSGERNYFIIGSERDMLNLYDSLLLKKKYQIIDLKGFIINLHKILKEEPIFYDSTTTCGLRKQYKILVLKSGDKYILPDKYKYEWSILPNKIKHGYRSGVAYKDSEPYLIYWVVAW